MAAQPWKLLARSWAEDAAERCTRAHRILTEAEAHLMPPMHIADAKDGRVRAQLASNILSEADTDLAAAATSMVAAEIFARRCGPPLHPTGYLPDADSSALLALVMLNCAKICADEARDRVARCSGRLQTADHLLGHPRLHGVGGIVDAERVAALGHLLAAQDIAVLGAELAATTASLVL